MPVDYANGKIYKIVCNITGDVYYGSTTQALSKRLGKHVSNYKSWVKSTTGKTTSFQIIARGDYDICLVETVVCKSKEQLHQRERFWIEGNDCVNKFIPGRSGKEYYEANREAASKRCKEYYDANREKICAKVKEYREANREAASKRCKEYYDANRETLIEKMKIYQELNKEKLAAHRKVKVQCGCGTTHAHGNQARHAKSQKHQLWLSSSTNHSQRCP